jgi:hypothetical protein
LNEKAISIRNDSIKPHNFAHNLTHQPNYTIHTPQTVDFSEADESTNSDDTEPTSAEEVKEVNVQKPTKYRK